MSNISNNYCPQCRHEYEHCKCRLQPPTDAAVWEAVGYLNAFRHALLTTVGPEFTARINVILSHARAVQSPRLTEAQVAALHIVWLRCKEEGNLTDVVEILESTFRAAFSSVFGKEG